MKNLRCSVCKQFVSPKDSVIQWLHNPSLNESMKCQIVHKQTCEYDEKKMLCDSMFVETIEIAGLDIEELSNRWERLGLNKINSFCEVMFELMDKFM